MISDKAPTCEEFVAEILRLHEDGDINAYGVYRQAMADPDRDPALVFIRKAAERDYLACLQGDGIFQEEFNGLAHGPHAKAVPLTVRSGIAALQRALVSAGSRAEGMHLVVRVHRPGAIGGTPSVPVVGIHCGIDWDANKCFLHLGTELTVLTEQEKADIAASLRAGESWHASQAAQALRAQTERVAAERDAVAAERQRLVPAAGEAGDLRESDRHQIEFYAQGLNDAFVAERWTDVKNIADHLRQLARPRLATAVPPADDTKEPSP